MILTPDGTPVLTLDEAAAKKEPTMGDLQDLLSRMGVQSARMKPTNANRMLFDEAAGWLVWLAQRVVTLQEAARREQSRIVRLD